VSDFVTLQEVKDFIRLSPSLGTRANAHVQQCLDQAEAIVARECSIQFSQAERVEHHSGGVVWISLAQGPVATITEISDVVADVILDGTDADEPDYALADNRVFRITSMGNRLRWPLGASRYRVTYTGGYTGATGDVPAPDGLRTPILILARNLYEDGSAEVTPEIGRKIEPFKAVVR